VFTLAYCSAPEVTIATAPAGPDGISQPVDVSGAFTDLDDDGTHSAGTAKGRGTLLSFCYDLPPLCHNFVIFATLILPLFYRFLTILLYTGVQEHTFRSSLDRQERTTS
jgi:hypothetical protein